MHYSNDLDYPDHQRWQLRCCHRGQRCVSGYTFPLELDPKTLTLVEGYFLSCYIKRPFWLSIIAFLRVTRNALRGCDLL